MISYYLQNIQVQAAHYKKGKLEFDYIKPDDFKEIEKNDTPSIIGEIKLSTIADDKKTDKVIIESNSKTFTYELIQQQKNSDSRKKTQKNIMGYIKVDNNTYVAVLKKSILIPIILLFAFLGILIGMLYLQFRANPTTTDTPDLEIAQGSDWDGNMPSNGEQSKANTDTIEIPGYSELYVSSENPSIQLINPELNTVYFVYTITENDTVIYETKAIEPNKMVEVNLQELLSKGEHNLKFQISTYDIETQASCNGATQDVKVIVKE